MKTLDEIHKQPEMHKTLLMKYVHDGMVFGWTFEQLGWNLDIKGHFKA